MHLRDRLSSIRPVVGAFVGFASPEAVEVAGFAGMDMVVIDLEHGPMTRSDLPTLLRAADSAGLSTCVRVPDADPKQILGVLESGPHGILVPMVNDAETAHAVVAAVRYPPAGRRGVYYGRGVRYGIDARPADLVMWANRTVIAVQIESRTAVEHAREIAKVDGVDALFLGPTDLSADLGRLGEVDDAEVWHALAHVTEVAHAAGRRAGTFCATAEQARRAVSIGVDFVLTTLTLCLAAGVRSYLTTVRPS